MADVVYMREYRKRYRETEEGRAKIVAGRKRWKSSVRGKQKQREYDKKRYVPSTRQLLSPEERKARTKASNLKSLNRPEYKEKRSQTLYWGHIRRAYGLTKEQYQAMAVDGCQICGERDTTKKRLHVDHCHETGRVRGLLCDPCNRGLGCFRDNTVKLEKALKYLRAV